MSKEIIKLPAFAKINLGLKVLGRRADGYHEIRTVFQTISLHDRLTFESSQDGRLGLACTDSSIPTDESNLVLRAADALRERYGVSRGARVTLEKRVPAGGGLGGGSSDAAATLVALSHLWNLKTDVSGLSELGSRLGADVPFFLTGGTALGTGTGTEIEPLGDVPETHLVVVTPAVRVSTAEAYKALGAPALTKEDALVNLSVSRTEADFPDSLCDVMSNDFEAVVVRLHPEIGRARDALLGAGAVRASLSGSGSSVYGVFESELEAGRASEALGGAEGGWRVSACATLTRAEYVAALGACGAILRPGRGA
ncbi:MAG TPA: 4-(cytidine 5'-diphospho)-2-C-methyl-D-erythritol kinase [Pyrinomonadaceae bacterium]|nr:4-(cytidine 5'-diphospho)-2-C-methyl-D-erythritol kinase [Pyrinomonadaceae bacterium]